MNKTGSETEGDYEEGGRIYKRPFALLVGKEMVVDVTYNFHDSHGRGSDSV